jgi:alginate O-acetyltransferase complex protein AlgI
MKVSEIMVFSSSLFIFGFLPIFLILYFIAPEKFKNPILLLGSFFFCFWGIPRFIFVVIFTLVIDYVLGGIIYRSKLANISSKASLKIRLCVALDVVMNLGILLYFKYGNFFLDNVNGIFKSMGLDPFVFTRIILPVGISFIIFQKVTYCLDIAKGICKPARNFFVLLTYILLFPHVIAGPIIKFGEIVNQIEHREHTWEKIFFGFQRFSVGLFKKVWLADVLAKYADMAFRATTLPFDAAWIGIFAYTFQIFFDFSAYSDMAIGLLAIMGFRINENFNKPYISASITEFWKRWHISLTSWMREYIYFPLGGNQKGKVRTYINLWIVFLISGFWHGASWNYVFWGAYHGGIICAERAFPSKKKFLTF